MFIDPKDKRKVIIQSEDKKIPILKEDISIVYVDESRRCYGEKATIHINNFSWLPERCFDSIKMNELVRLTIIEDICDQMWNDTIKRETEREKYWKLQEKIRSIREKLLGDMSCCRTAHNLSERELQYYLKNRRWYDHYKNNMPATETKSTVEQIMKMIGKNEFIKIPIEWSFKETNNYRDFMLDVNKTIFEGYYRPKTPVIKPSDKKTHVHIHVHHVHNKNYTSKNINIDINQLIDKIISGLMDRIFAFGNIKGKTTDTSGKASPDIEEAEIINATEEICRSLVPVHQQKDIRSVIVRRVNEIVRRH